MSWTKEVTLWCDAEGCGAWHQESSLTVDQLRRSLRPQGWAHVEGRDLCPAHRPKAQPIPPLPPLPEGVEAVPLAEFVAEPDSFRRSRRQGDS